MRRALPTSLQMATSGSQATQNGRLTWSTAFSVRNDRPEDISFTSGGLPISDAQTIQRWVPQPVGANPYLNPAYGIPDANLTFKLSPAGRPLRLEKPCLGEVAVDISSRQLHGRNVLAFDPRGATR